MQETVTSQRSFASPGDEGERLISLRNAAARVGVSSRTIYRLLASSAFPKPRRIGRKILFRHSDLLAYMKGGAV